LIIEFVEILLSKPPVHKLMGLYMMNKPVIPLSSHWYHNKYYQWVSRIQIYLSYETAMESPIFHIIYKTYELLHIRGFENKVSSNLMSRKRLRKNGIGVNAVAQTDTQILGTANRLKAVNAVVDNLYIMLAINGSQFVYVKRGLTIW